MKYLLDTDHLSILQRQTGKDYSNLLYPSRYFMAIELSEPLQQTLATCL